MSTDKRMDLRRALVALRRVRRDEDVVITTMGAAREWMALGTQPRDLVLVPSAMGHATSLGLGLALAQPARRIIVMSGDGSLLMNLGSLVTITAIAPPNLVLIVFDNGVFEVTGAQPTAGSAAARASGRRVDLAQVAGACGFTSLFHFSGLRKWTESVPTVLDATGPTFVLLDVEPVPGAPGPKSPGSTGVRAQKFMEAIGAPSAIDRWIH